MRSNDDGAWAVVDYVYPADEWLHFVFNHDANTGRFSLSINDERVINSNRMQFGEPVNAMDWLCFSDVATDDVYLDDIIAQNIIEDERDAGPVRHTSNGPLSRITRYTSTLSTPMR
jgi:hypothetical protein